MSKIIDLTKVVEQSWASESRIQLKESGIPLTIRIQNPRSIEKKKNPGISMSWITLYGTTSIKLFMVEIILKGFETLFEHFSNTLKTLSRGS